MPSIGREAISAVMSTVGGGDCGIAKKAGPDEGTGWQMDQVVDRSSGWMVISRSDACSDGSGATNRGCRF